MEVLFPQYFQSISIPLKTFPHYGIEQNYGNWTSNLFLQYFHTMKEVQYFQWSFKSEFIFQLDFPAHFKWFDKRARVKLTSVDLVPRVPAIRYFRHKCASRTCRMCVCFSNKQSLIWYRRGQRETSRKTWYRTVTALSN